MKCRFSKKKVSYICYMLIISTVIGFFTNDTGVYGYDERQAVVVGIVEGSTLRVRNDAGTNGTTVIYSLKNNTAVTVIGEKYASDGSLWYKIRFSDGDKNIEGYSHSMYIEIIYTSDTDFEQYMNEQGFPESYKPALRTLHEKYPNWIFKADKVKYTWKEVLEAENVIGRSLVGNEQISSYKSTVGAAYNWTTGKWTGYDGDGWVQASNELIAYCLDPRNFLDEKYIFQFETLQYNQLWQDEEGIKKIIAGTFMENGKIENNMTYSSALLEAAEKSGVSPFHLASSIRLEIGTTKPSEIISGKVLGYEGYYNYYNWNAYVSGGKSAVENGLIFAMKTDTSTLRPWDTRYKAIVGGAMKLGNDYVNRGQNTTYYRKFDLISPYYHQYMTHILAAKIEGARVAEGYTDEMKKNLSLEFIIPVYEDMPSSPCPIPTGDGSPNNALKSLSVSNATLTPTFNPSKPIDTTSFTVKVPNSTKSVMVSASTYDSRASLKGTGTKNLNVGSNKVQVTVTAQNGDVRTYTINIIREEGTTPEAAYSISLPKDDSAKIIRGLSANMSVEAVKKKFDVKNGTLEIRDKNNNVKTTGNVGTGDKAVITDLNGTKVFEYTFVLYGDVDGDGIINIKDALLIRKHNLGERKLGGVYLLAGDVDRGNDGVNIKDALVLRKYNLGQRSINQQ